EQRGTPVRGAVAIFPGGYTVSRDYGAAPGRILPRLLLDGAIVEQATRSGAVLHEGHRVEHGGAGRDGVRITARCTEAKARALARRGRALIAADGPGSVARRAVGLPHAAEQHLGVAATAYFSGVRLREPQVSEHYFSKS